jgi:hypothetical protein
MIQSVFAIIHKKYDKMVHHKIKYYLMCTKINITFNEKFNLEIEKQTR